MIRAALAFTTSLVFLLSLCCFTGLVRFPFSGYATIDYAGADIVDEALIAHEDSDFNARKPENYVDVDPISAALADHGDNQFVLRRISTKMTKDMQLKRVEAMKEASWKIANEKAREEHPWDDLPEGMPTHDGRMISSADLVSGNINPEPSAQSYALSSVRNTFTNLPQLQRQAAQPAQQRGDTVDPMAVADLDGALDSHEELHAARAPRQGPMPAAVTSRGGAAKGHGNGMVHQGFVTGDHLRVQPKEYYHEMKRFLPSSDGRLISPFEWFQTGGRGYSR
jgi:hypothetical protein